MGQMKLGITVAGVIVALLGVAAFVTMRSDGSNGARPVAREAPAESAPLVGAAPASSAPSTKPPAVAGQPSPQDVQAAIAAITATLASPSNSAAPLTKEQVETQLREQLKLLGISY
jgi:hypothetical protein